MRVCAVETSRRRRPSSTIYILMGQTILEKTPGSASHWGGFVSPEHLMPPWASPSGLRGRTPPWVGVDLSDLAVFKPVTIFWDGGNKIIRIDGPYLSIYLSIYTIL